MATIGLANIGDRLGPQTAAVVDAVLGVWPEHAKFLNASLQHRSPELLDTTETIAALLSAVATECSKPLSAYAADYRYLFEVIVFQEEIFFRREGHYRLSTHEEAADEVYNNASLMARYMNGLFVSDALWLNHASAMHDFAKTYLPGAKVGGRHLEIGPGHGMLLHLALLFGNFKHLAAWDVSTTSVEHTRRVLNLLGEGDRVELRLQDLYSANSRQAYPGCFDTVVLSEVLEHLERPREAIEIIRELLAPGGSVWINAPANGPAPDHLFLLRSPRELADLVATAGLEVARMAAFPVAGSSLDRALRQELPISCVVVGRKAS